jgi:hypothetical protein
MTKRTKKPKRLVGAEKHLFEICQGTRTPSRNVTALPNELTENSLVDLRNMVFLEFATSVWQRLKETSKEKDEPHPYDVFLVKTPSNKKPQILLALPVPGSQDIQWHDGSSGYWPRTGTDAPRPVKKLASLSGPTRVLNSIQEYKGRNSLMHKAMKRQGLVKAMASGPNNVHIQSITQNMNAAQSAAVATAASPLFRDGFFAILGPPGCGKTTTMVGMIRAMAEKRLIVTAPSNAAVANIALKLYHTGQMPFGQMCVFGSNCHPSVHFLSPTHRRRQYQRFRRKYEACKTDAQRQSQCQKLAKWLHLKETPSVEWSVLSKACPNVNRYTQWGTQKFQKLLANAQVIFCTLNTAGSKFLHGAAEKKRFDTLLLDEAGQCPEAEFYIATSFPGVERIIVVGDPKQLPATVISQHCCRAGYKESWLGRVYAHSPERVHLLDIQYRMDPGILAFPNQCFYGNRIQSGSNVSSRSPTVEFPFRFIDTSGSSSSEKRNRSSWINQNEAHLIRQVLDEDSDIQRLRREMALRPRIIIITPYSAQVDLLQKMFQSDEEQQVEVSTVDSYQGQEGDIVIVSTVRTKKVGFVDDPQRLNVALTRAKRLVRVVADREFCLSLQGDSTLRALALYAQEQDTNVRITTQVAEMLPSGTGKQELTRKMIATSPPGDDASSRGQEYDTAESKSKTCATPTTAKLLGGDSNTEAIEIGLRPGKSAATRSQSNSNDNHSGGVNSDISSIDHPQTKQGASLSKRSSTLSTAAMSDETTTTDNKEPSSTIHDDVYIQEEQSSSPPPYYSKPKVNDCSLS